jgi:hypothetical protein
LCLLSFFIYLRDYTFGKPFALLNYVIPLSPPKLLFSLKTQIYTYELYDLLGIVDYSILLLKIPAIQHRIFMEQRKPGAHTQGTPCFFALEFRLLYGWTL